ncbi:MAG: sugar-binding protein [Halothermotrichaceae bacterium]
MLTVALMVFTSISIIAANEFDSKGRMVAHYGSPVIDGQVDDIWETAQAVTPQYVSENVETFATFKVLWDDDALYILAEVKDKNLSIESETPYMQDSFEIFLDEYNNKTQAYGVDDLHFRVNYQNLQTVDVGNGERFYTKTSPTKDGYLIESRLALKKEPENGQVLGIELQINDAKGTNRIGTLNLFDSTGTAWNDTSKFGEIKLTGKKEDAMTGLNSYGLINLLKETQELDLTQYKNADILQKQIDKQYNDLKETINKLKLTDEATNEKTFETVPDEYRSKIEQQGKIERLEYKAASTDGGTDTKYMNVYLPYQYDANKKYDVLYLMHGGSEDENTIFGGPGENKELKKMIDNMIAQGDIEPLIVVTPTFYGGSNDTEHFPEELINKVIPLVETKYSTYADSINKEGLKASREHRAFGGFSMGSVTTWYTYIDCLDYFKYFMPLSGDCWVLGQKAGSEKPEETAKYLANVAKKAGYTPDDFYIFSATGRQDIAYPNLKPQIDAMKKLDSFIYSSDTDKGNFYFLVSEEGTHAWNWVNQYIYNILPDLFVN